MKRVVLVAVLALGAWGAGCERGAGTGGEQAGTGGSGAAGQAPDARPPAGTPEAWRGCAPGAQQREPAQVVAGTVRSATRQTLTIEEPGGRLVELSTDPGTCILQAGRSVAPEALREGAEVRAGYEVRNGQSVARLVRAGPAADGMNTPGNR
jgi:hypothetical protein